MVPRSRATLQADVWSLGVAWYEMACLKAQLNPL